MPELPVNRALSGKRTFYRVLHKLYTQTIFVTGFLTQEGRGGILIFVHLADNQLLRPVRHEEFNRDQQNCDQKEGQQD